ncbi:unnamed protein product [Brachionus calyciflorus]|uniref:Uncharacterized protein n=1 Tax=Brachionus calyciflorus TaxID=104777 RepID=A0A813SJ26_9BILA|nr:unnamed protein product [Brachionus calyciflorus]
MPCIIWVDSDPNVVLSAKFLHQQNYDLKFFNETLDCLNYVQSIDNHSDIRCIITSMMKRKSSYSPFLVMITMSADEQECKDIGFDIIFYNDHYLMQKLYPMGC